MMLNVTSGKGLLMANSPHSQACTSHVTLKKQSLALFSPDIKQKVFSNMLAFQLHAEAFILREALTANCR